MQHWFTDTSTPGCSTAGSLGLGPWTGARRALAVLARSRPRVVTLAGRLGTRIRDLDSRPVPDGAVRAVAGAVGLVLSFGVLGGLVLALHPPDRPTTRFAASLDLAHLKVQAPEGSSTVGPSGGDTALGSGGPVVGRAEPRPHTATVAAASIERDAAPTLLPTGKGMWFNRLEDTGDSPQQIVERARAAGLTHLYVRLGSSKKGFYGHRDLDRLLPLAHDAGIAVVGWDFPYLGDPGADARRALAEIRYTTPTGDRIDAFSADIETSSEGVQDTPDRVASYGRMLRDGAGPGYPLVATVPNACLSKTFPYAQAAESFDAFAPMVYWITRDPAADVACNIDRLRPLGRPVLPVGQAYDPALDNPTLVGLTPGYDQLTRFMEQAASKGAAGVSFWAWHTATADMWRAVADEPDFTLVPLVPGSPDTRHVAALQRVLNLYGFETPVDGRYEAGTVGALARLQNTLGIAPTGELGNTTIAELTGPSSR